MVDREKRASQLAALRARREELLDTFVAAYLDQPEPFRAMGGDGVMTVYHPGFAGNQLVPDWDDITALGSQGKLNVRNTGRGHWEIGIPPAVLDRIVDSASEPVTSIPVAIPMPGISDREGAQPLKGHTMTKASNDPAEVWVIYGRNGRVRDEIFDLLRKVHLHPIEFIRAVHRSGQASPVVLDVVLREIRQAPAIVAILSPDDYAELREDLRSDDSSLTEEERTEPGYQPRQNVLLETGMALAAMRDRTIVLTTGRMRGMSDLGGIHDVRWDNSEEKRFDLVGRLANLNLPVNRDGIDWLKPSR